MNDETRVQSPPIDAPVVPRGAAETADGNSVSGQPVETLVQTSDDVAQSRALAGSEGKVSLGGYEILGVLGRGGMGVVYKARHLKLNRIVALKMLLGAQHADPKELARFVAEAQSVAEIKHANVIQIFDSGEIDGHPYMAMECLEGGSLSQRLKEHGPLTARAAAELLIRIARGVQAAHDRGIVHRDLKPHNVLLDTAAGDATPAAWGEPKVMDFGLAKRGRAELTTTGAIMGTPAYMAPEQARGDTKNVGPAADIYALGVILYECVSGTVPFQGSDAWSVIRQVVSDDPQPLARRIHDTPVELDLICRMCLEKEPRARYASPAALADDLERFLQGKPIRGPRTGPGYKVQKLVGRWWRHLAAVGSLVVIIIAAWLLPSPLDWLRGPNNKPDDGLNPVAAILREQVAKQVAVLRRTPPAPDRNSPHPASSMAEMPSPESGRFHVSRDERVMDLRAWRPSGGGGESAILCSTRREMMKLAPAEELRIESRAYGRSLVMRALRPNAENARFATIDAPGESDAAPNVGQLIFDVRDIPVQQEFILRYATTAWPSSRTNGDTGFEATGYEGPVKISMLILFPDDRPFLDYQLLSTQSDSDDGAPSKDLHTFTGPAIEFAAEDKSWIYWEIPNPKKNERYRIEWTW